jgi:hypothetical protein
VVDYFCEVLLTIKLKGILMSLNQKGTGNISANGGKCPTGVKFLPYENPHGAGCPGGYDDTLAGVDSDIKDTMKGVRRAFKPRRP